MSSNFVSVIFCRKCGSRYVEISRWSDEGRAIFECRGCGAHEEVGNFTLGRGCITNSELQNARDTTAKKGNYERSK